MSVQTALPSHAWNSDGAILTFIIPAIGGCDLACPFCFIDQRGESRLSNSLRAEDYTRFVREIVAVRSVASLCIQGYEPLLPDSFPFARALLKVGKKLGIPTSLVTNGTRLAERAHELRVLAPGRISVSLDAAEPETHDRQRRKVGAFAATVAGLRKAVSTLSEETELGVTSVLIPKRRAQLDDLPALLKAIGVKRWTVTALQKVRANSIGGPVGERERILNDLRILDCHARAAGINFTVDDEFAGLGRFDDADREQLRIHRLIQPEGVYRLVPDGRCSKGAELLQPLLDETPSWDPKTMDAGAFLQSLS